MPDSQQQDDYTRLIEQMLAERLGDRSTRISNDELNRLADFSKDGRLDRYNLWQNYYNGDQGTMLTDRERQYLERSGLRYAENICQVTSDAYAERLRIVGITTDEDAPPETPAPETPEDIIQPKEREDPSETDLGPWLWKRVWDGSQGDELQIDIHRDYASRGDAFVIVDYDTVRLRPRFIRNLPNTIKVIYGANGVKKLAVKKWYTTDMSPTNPAGRSVCRLNLYYPDRIEKWFTLAKEGGATSGTWLEWLDDPETGEDPVWPTKWTLPDGKTGIGIPVFHFANRRDDTYYGTAEHKIVIPLQDRLNKELLDLANVLDQMGAPQRYATGIADTSNLKSVPGELWSTQNPEAQFGQFDAADPAGLLSSIESTINRAASISRTPKYMLELTGGTPSGEALKTAESGLVSKVENGQPALGNQWAEAFRMGAVLAHIYGGTAEGEKPPANLGAVLAASINVNWKDPRTFDELQHLQALQVMQALGIPDEYLWSRIEGLDVEQIKQMKAANDVANAAIMAASFDRGGDTNPAEPGQGAPFAPSAGGNGGARPFGPN